MSDTQTEIAINDAITFMRELPCKSIDAILTDPPYCAGGFTEKEKMAASRQGVRSESLDTHGWFSNDNMTTGGLVWLLRSMMIEAERILKDDSSVFVFTDWRMVPFLAPALESSGLRYRNMLIWDKQSMGMGHGFRARHEVILHFIKGKGKFYESNLGNVIQYPRVKSSERSHPTEKPVGLLECLIRVVTKQGDTVLDPFCGSGSTGVACQRLNRSFIGVERSSHYADVAMKKIESDSRQLDLLTIQGN